MILSINQVTIAAGTYQSHPPLRPDPEPANRALAEGPSFFVDARQGKNNNKGSKDKPWRTIEFALTKLSAGDTLYLRNGIYFENVAVRLQGKEDAPITIRSYPGEQGIIDGGIAEFNEQPATAWEPFPDGGEGEYRSRRRHPNIRDVIGAFGDSMIGLETYWHLTDLRSTNELADPVEPGGDLKPLWCGPGLHYDRETGYIHARLAHTKLNKIDNYQGETDPRKLPLVVSPFRSVPLHIDRAQHIRLQDLIIRGGGYETVVIDFGVSIDFDNVVIRGGTYCMRTSNTGPLRFYRSAMYGNSPPWMFRGDGSLRNRPGRGRRDIVRLTCHALWTTNTGREFSVYAFPVNNNWDISYSEFTDSHDGPYFGGIGMRFHHNLLDNFQDDGIYLSPMYAYGPKVELHIYQNVFSRCLTPLAFGGPEDTKDQVYIYRNIFDMRGTVNTGRPSTKRPDPGQSTGRIMGDHGGPPWSAMNIYQNTFVTIPGMRGGGMGALGHLRKGYPRRVFNNIFFQFARLPGPGAPKLANDVHTDANLYWSPAEGAAAAAEKMFAKYRKLPAFEASKAEYAAGFTTNSLAADPLFTKAVADGGVANDYRLQDKSPALKAGVPLPPEWPDPLRQEGQDKPDLGAMPHGAEPLRVGRAAAPAVK